MTLQMEKRVSVGRPTSEIFRRRRRALSELLQRKKWDAYFFSGMADLYYLTGFMADGFYGLFTAEGETWLFASALLAGQVRDSTQGCRLVVGRRLSKALRSLMGKHGLKRVGFDSEQLMYRLGAILVREGLRPGENPAAELRAVKAEEELACVRRACQLTADGIEFAKKRLKPGMTEKGLAAELEMFFYRRGADKAAFDLVVAMGPHTALPHHLPGPSRLVKNQPVILDIGCMVGGYRADLTRTLYYGKIFPLFRRVYRTVQAAQHEGIARVKPGMTGGRIDAATRGVISRAGYGRYFIHSTGHGVGLDIHEAPWIRPKSGSVLSPGMVLTIEPGIYLPGRFGVRIEDTLRVTDTGSEILTRPSKGKM
ncbi:MAG TPA: Xaa-Pro peptidase family protein [Elusimicrobiota bacterium]|nr:Xaa-Pro peptidase family protein [Elusimicrobiota bacterium]